MPGWSRWMAGINPLAYGFEALMANEFHHRDFPCVNMVPSGQGYANLSFESQICSVVGSETGSAFVNGDNYINKSFDYWNVHKWRSVYMVSVRTHELIEIYDTETSVFFVHFWPSFSLPTWRLPSLRSHLEHGAKFWCSIITNALLGHQSHDPRTPRIMCKVAR